jgi:hypothetical protein
MKQTMNRIFMLMLLPVISVTGVAQEIGLPSFEYVRQSEVWLSSENAAGLQYLPIQKISSAEVFFNKSNGEFVNYFQSDNSYEWGAQTESFFRLNPQIVFYGKVHYANFTGKNMGGSAFIDPYYNPFGIVEMTDDARGEKNKENYHLIGAVSAKMSDQWTIGGKIDYTAINYAKHKDLRHSNKYLDMTATAGLSYSFAKLLDVGINYLYRRSVEGLFFDIYGTTDKMYESLIDFGAFYGRKELFGSGGLYTKESNSPPVFNEFQGAALQLNVRFSPGWQFFNEFSYQSRKGYYGKKSPYTPILTEHHAGIIAYSGTLSYREQTRQQDLKVQVNREQLNNYENIFKENPSSEGGNKDILYYGDNQMLDRTVLQMKATYTANLGIVNQLPAWTLQAGGDFCNRQQTVSVYPFYRKQTIRFFNARLSACKNTAIDRKNRYDISLDVLYGSGNGTVFKDGIYVTPSENQKSPETTVFNLYCEYEYLTAPRITGTIGLAYSRLLNPLVQGYVRAHYEMTRARQIEYLEGNLLGAARLAIGCVF